jgi:hypothetical protein
VPSLYAPDAATSATTAASIAKEVVSFDTARSTSAFALFYIFVLCARVAHQLQPPVRTARYAIGSIASVGFVGGRVVAIDLVCLTVEAAPGGSSARRSQGERPPVANQHGSRIEGAGICAHFLAGVSGLAKGGIAIEMPIGSDGASLRSSAIAPKLESACFANEGARRIGAAGVVRRLLPWATIALLGDRIVTFVRFPLARATTSPPARHLGPFAALAEETPIVGGAKPLAFDVALAPDPRGGPACSDDRDDDRSGDYGDSRRSSTQG